MTLTPDVSFEVEPVILELVEATNREDSEGLLAVFSDDAVLDDWGRHFSGRDRIAVWNEHENIGNHSRITLLAASVAEVEESHDPGVTAGLTTVLQVDVSGDGYAGAGTFTVTTKDGLIVRLAIRSGGDDTV